MQGRDKPFCTNISGNAGGFGFRFRSAGADCWSLWCRISFLADPGRFLFCFRWLSFGNPLCDFLHTIRGGTIRFPVAIMFIIFRYRFYNFIPCCLGVWIYNVSYFQYYTTVTTKLVLYSLYFIHGCFGPPQAENFGVFGALLRGKRFKKWSILGSKIWLWKNILVCPPPLYSRDLDRRGGQTVCYLRIHAVL